MNVSLHYIVILFTHTPLDGLPAYYWTSLRLLTLMHLSSLFLFVIYSTPFLHHKTMKMCFNEPCKEKHNMLNNMVKEFEFGDEWSDECDYVEEDDFREIVIENSENIEKSIIQLNIRGLFGKQDKLLKLINCCNKSKIDIIILEETWLNKKNQKEISIPGYEFIGQAQTNKKGGGVGILINNKIKYRVRKDLYVESDLFENCTIEPQTVQRHLLVSAVYRPPNTNQKEFIESFKTFNDLVYHSKLEWIVELDHNMDLLKIDQNKYTSDIMVMLLGYELYPVIT